jgi:type VI secretion system secreted protein VgrG
VIKSTGAHIHITAATEIKLEVGASKLLMKSDGSIQLKGVDIAIDGVSVNIHGGSVTSKADKDHNIEGNIVLSSGTATNTVKGGMVMLNP